MKPFVDPFLGMILGRTKRDATLLLQSGLFDLGFYASQVGAHEKPSLSHFLQHGWRRGLSPSPFFDSVFYTLTYADVKKAGWNPVLHYIRHGWREGRTPHPRFDIAGYIAGHPHVDFQSIDPLRHCIEHYRSLEWGGGASKPAAPGTIDYPALASEQGQLEALFDREYYISMYEDVREAGTDPFLHYTWHGCRENRNPSPEFDTWYFLKNHPEFADAQDSPLHQFVRAGMPAHWKLRSPDSVTLDPASQNLAAAAAAAAAKGRLRLAVHVHAYYPEYIEEVHHALTRIPYPLGLFVTACTAADERFIFHYLTRRNPRFSFKVQLVENRGRDIGPMLTAFPQMWKDYDIVAHLHSKKSPHTGFGDNWRKYALEQMFGSPELVDSVMSFLEENEDVGFFFPDNYLDIKKYVEWGISAQLIDSLLERANLPKVERPKIAEFAAGSMAWFRTSAFRVLVDTFTTSEDFDLEDGQLDTTVAHAIEHVFPLVVKAQGFRAVCYYPKRRSHLPTFEPRHMSVPAPRNAERGWMRNDPRSAGQPRVALQPFSRVFDARRLDIHWVIPDFIRGAGGHMTIFRFVEILERFGHRQTIWIQNLGDNPGEVKARIQSWYRPVKGNVFVNFLPDDTHQMAGDVIIATDCWTVYPVISTANFKERFYFIQDYEPYFHPAGENYLVAEQTYRMGFCGLCAGDWLKQKMQAFGMWVRKWDLAVDRDFYFPDAKRQLDYSSVQEVRIAFYARGYTPRRAKRLGIAAFEELQRRGVSFRVVMFGEEPENNAHSFNYEERGILPPEKLAEVYRKCHIGVVFSTTNYSLIPLEMMACNLPVVEIDTESTRAIFKDGEVSFSAPDPGKIADAIEELTRNAGLLARQQEKARNFVSGLSWENSVRSVETAILDRLGERGFQAIEPERICAPALHRKPYGSVFIPTFNTGPQFKAVLERLTGQDTPFKYDILVIDSGSSDDTLDVVKSFKAKNVRLQQIANKEFQHGRTRNLGIASTEGDYVAILTQDALPSDRYWLARLIGGFAVSPRVGGVIGRHKAYPEHGPFIARDLNAMFDRLADFGPLYSLEQGLPSFLYPAGLHWQMTLQFYSDNNSAMARSVWKVLPYPEIDWGEDQVWAWEMLRAGFHKAYIDDACVFHSHRYAPEERYNVAVTEGSLFARHFGWNLHPNPEALEAEIEGMNIRDTQYAVANKIPYKQLKQQKQLNKATIEGRAHGAAGQERSSGTRTSPHLYGPPKKSRASPR
ncbi:MAG: glycosyltransferase [Pseudomonadota bacterium]|nr:glycosyltransferase [Pseudomonadota bacterium]